MTFSTLRSAKVCRLRLGIHLVSIILTKKEIVIISETTNGCFAFP
jgi:hypothetical protein